MVRGAAYAGASTPVVEGPILAGWLLRAVGTAFPWSDHLAVLATGDVQLADAGGGPVLTGTLDTVAWPESAAALVRARPAGRRAAGGDRRARRAPAPARPGRTPRASPLPAVSASTACRSPPSRRPAWRSTRPPRCSACGGPLARAVAMTAALQRTAELTIGYAGQRVQFGQPIARFQAVQTHLARLASEAQRAAVVVDAVQAALDDAR